MSTIPEIWKPIPSLDGWYDASNLGRIRSWKGLGQSPSRRSEAYVLKPTPGRSYARVNAYAPGTRRRSRTVHRLVAEAFLGPCPAGLVVLHRNNNDLDNRIENLKYGTNSQNQLDRIANNTSNRGVANGANKLTKEDVLLVLEKRQQGLTQAAIAVEMGVSRKAIAKILTGQTWGWFTGIDTA